MEPNLNTASLLKALALQVDSLYWKSQNITWSWQGTAGNQAEAIKLQLQESLLTLSELSAETAFRVEVIEAQIREEIFHALGGAIS